MTHFVAQFSCGAASAVATRLILTEAAAAGDRVSIVNARIAEEHDDNRRFLADCERWFGQSVVQLADERYGASTFEVWRRERYLKGPHGAPCSRALKRKVLAAFLEALNEAEPPTQVLGFDADEVDRFDDFRDRYPDLRVRAPLIERELGKGDCLAIVQRAGIELPAMYRLGFNNANCIGCVKGGAGYWNKVRRVFPLRFEEMATLEESLGPGAYLFRNRATGVRYGLRQLDAREGRDDEPLPACSFYCDAAHAYIEGAA